MFPPTVTESPAALEPVTRDPFIDGPDRPPELASAAHTGATPPPALSTPEEIR